MHDILDMMPEGVRANKARVILAALIGSMEMLEGQTFHGRFPDYRSLWRVLFFAGVKATDW